MKQEAAKRVVVVGGGISGLAAAWELQCRTRSSNHPITITLCEASNRLGGRIHTETTDRFVIEGGPDTFLTSKPAGVDLCEELDLTDQLIATRSETRQSFISLAGRLAPLPDGMSGLVPRRMRGLLGSAILTRRGRLRACLEPLVPKSSTVTDESVSHFATRRYGREVAEKIIEPLLSGIYAGDGRVLSARSAAPQLVAMEEEFGSVFRGARSHGVRSNGGSPFVSLSGGLGTLVERLRERLSEVETHIGTAVTEVTRSGNGFRVSFGSQTVEAAAVILATPSFCSAEMTRHRMPALSDMLSRIRFVSTATVTLGFTPRPRTAPTRGYGYIVPRTEGIPVTACTWTTLKLRNRSDDQSFLLRVFVGRDGEDERVEQSTDETLSAIALAELDRTLGITQPPSIIRVHRHIRAMPQYEVGHLDRMAHIDRLLEEQRGLFLAGCSYRGVGIPDCIVSGRRAATAALGSLS